MSGNVLLETAVTSEAYVTKTGFEPTTTTYFGNEHSAIQLNGWVFVYKLSGCGFESHCSHLCFLFLGNQIITASRIINLTLYVPTPKKWSNTLKQFVGNWQTNCLSVLDHFVGLALKRLTHEMNMNERYDIIGLKYSLKFAYYLEMIFWKRLFTNFTSNSTWI